MAYRRPSRRSLPGFGPTLGCTLAYMGLIVLLPIGALLAKSASMGWPDFVAAVTSQRALASYRVTAGAALGATLFNAVFGLLVAWILVRYRFPGRRLLDSLVDMPFALPTAVAGIVLTALFVPTGWFGRWLEPLGIQVAFTWTGIVMAMAFTSMPFVIRSTQAALEELDPEAEQAARVLGATGPQIFLRVIFPTIFAPFLAGCTLAFARSLGEFGAVIFIAGNLPMETEITTLLTVIRLEEFDYPAAAALATVTLLAALAILALAGAVQRRHLRFVGRP
jgi:sulfate transport system permease protein